MEVAGRRAQWVQTLSPCTCQRKSGRSPGGELGILFLGSKGRRELLKPMRPLEVSENFGSLPVPGCGERNASDSHRRV